MQKLSKKLIKKLQPFWEARKRHEQTFRTLEEAVEFDMEIKLGLKCEFCYGDDGCFGIWVEEKRKKNGNRIGIIVHDTELEGGLYGDKKQR